MAPLLEAVDLGDKKKPSSAAKKKDSSSSGSGKDGKDSKQQSRAPKKLSVVKAEWCGFAV